MLEKVRELYLKEYNIEYIAKHLGISLREARWYYSECSGSGLIKF